MNTRPSAALPRLLRILLQCVPVIYWGGYVLIFFYHQHCIFQTFLVVQRLGVRLSMQGTQVPSQPRKIPYAAEQLSPFVTTVEPVLHKRSHCNEKPSPQLEKACTHRQWPSTDKNKQTNLKQNTTSFSSSPISRNETEKMFLWEIKALKNQVWDLPTYLRNTPFFFPYTHFLPQTLWQSSRVICLQKPTTSLI